MRYSFVIDPYFKLSPVVPERLRHEFL